MGDLALQTAVEPLAPGRYRGLPSDDWEIWGPQGGYIASLALRAAAHEGLDRPAAFNCHFLGVAAFEPVDIEVIDLKRGRSALSQRVSITQGGKPIVEALVWSIAPNEGLEHHEVAPPDVPGHEDLALIQDLLPDDAPPPFKFWLNLDAKPIEFRTEWPPEGPLPPRWRQWLRFTPTPAWDDPWVDATRSVVLVDIPSWPSAHSHHAWRQPPYTAPTLDLSVAFHQRTSGDEWLLCEGFAPVAADGLFGWTARLWATDGRLLSSGGGQCLFRKMRQPPTA